jgi:uncharacterized SAM-binding protein YcdF (DUF218 family)
MYGARTTCMRTKVSTSYGRIFLAVQLFVGPWPLFTFLILYTGGRTPWTGVQPVARHLPKHRTTQTQNKRIHTPNIHALSGFRTHNHCVRANEESSRLRPLGYRDRLASEQAKTVHALDRSATVAG